MLTTLFNRPSCRREPRPDEAGVEHADVDRLAEFLAMSYCPDCCIPKIVPRTDVVTSGWRLIVECRSCGWTLDGDQRAREAPIIKEINAAEERNFISQRLMSLWLPVQSVWIRLQQHRQALRNALQVDTPKSDGFLEASLVSQQERKLNLDALDQVVDSATVARVRSQLQPRSIRRFTVQVAPLAVTADGGTAVSDGARIGLITQPTLFKLWVLRIRATRFGALRKRIIDISSRGAPVESGPLSANWSDEAVDTPAIWELTPLVGEDAINRLRAFDRVNSYRWIEIKTGPRVYATSRRIVVPMRATPSGAVIC